MAQTSPGDSVRLAPASAIAKESTLEGTVAPLIYWVPSIAVTGMTFYQGDVFTAWRKSAFVGGLHIVKASRGRIYQLGEGDWVRGLSEHRTFSEEFSRATASRKAHPWKYRANRHITESLWVEGR